MIRRNVTTEKGQADWLLISQVDHARLSGELAEHWCGVTAQAGSALLPLVAREELLPAIYHHDDGWADWEQAPQVDFQTGRPLTFTEMPLPLALQIWRGSIARALQIGPLAAWVVASHFTALLGRSHEAQQPLAVAWLGEFELLRNYWLRTWATAHPAQHTLEQAETALHQLQLFDLLSLWLCMAERTEAHELATPGEAPLTLTPLPHSDLITMRPWPLAVKELELSVTGRLVPVRAYTDGDALAAVPPATQSLTWRITSH
jgi:hypothetical protein